ncbi:MAG: aminotransferase class I/II-fold pyridoxal phosphate-dependent enzyme, partial [Clostridia bacterium]|nr:aminotransferase class I/II-fold pyridoxal phosphate-dependent enzyme [Clostridia bacterium]
MIYRDKTKDFLEKELAKEKANYEEILKQNVKIDISRGKPCKEQLDLSMEMLNMINSVADLPEDGADIRNYGGIEGIYGMRQLFGEMLGVKAENVLVGGNSSLNMMYDTIQRCMQFGVNGSTPWNKLEKVKFLCPAPGYDRHFSLTAVFGIELITIPMDENGPIMDVVEKLVANDDAIKGIWCVPKYSNPTGIVFSDEVVDRLAKMPTKAEDFRIFWDNAYVVHDLYDGTVPLKNIYTACLANGNPNRVFIFASTSKITFPGAGVACFASSEENLKDALKTMKFQTIGPDKINQYLHLKFLKDMDGVRAIMKKHAAIIRPKFDTILNVLEDEFGENSDIANWSNPKGGYFISYNVLNGCAKKVYELCKNAGLVITTVGDTFPYGKDDNDSNIRIAPTFTNTNQLDTA